MKKSMWFVIPAVFLVLGFSLGFSFPNIFSGGGGVIFNPGAVFAMTNSPTGNEVVMFNRDHDGALMKIGSIPTQGSGTGGNDLDPLTSQGSIVLTPDGRWLLAANAGSNDITVFQAKSSGLVFVEKDSSNGTMPVSITVNKNTVYVLNGGSPNITGFTMTSSGHLTAIAGSTRTLTGTAPFTQVGISTEGKWLVVTDKGAATNNILVFSLTSGVPATSPVASSSSGAGPFGFIFDHNGHLLVVEAAAMAVSSYSTTSTGQLSLISGSVANGQAAACWIAGNNRYVFTANPGGSSISSYSENGSGALTLLNSEAATPITALDIGISRDGKYLYALDPGFGGIDMFKINNDGSLVSWGTILGGFPKYAQGIAVA